MTKCPKCGAVQPSNDKCADCGFRIGSWSVRPPPPPTPMAKPMNPRLAHPTLFGDVGCPHCGVAISVSYGSANAAVPLLGIAGALMLMPFVARYECATHGKLRLLEFPSPAARVLLLRRVLLLLSGCAVLAFVVALLVALKT